MGGHNEYRFDGGPGATCPTGPITLAALVALRAGGLLNPACHYVVNDWVQGTQLPGPNLVEFHAVSATELSDQVSVQTPLDTKAWRGRFDVDLLADQMFELEDNSENKMIGTPVDTSAVTNFDWGNPSYAGCEVSGRSSWILTPGVVGSFFDVKVRNDAILDTSLVGPGAALGFLHLENSAFVQVINTVSMADVRCGGSVIMTGGNLSMIECVISDRSTITITAGNVNFLRNMVQQDTDLFFNSVGTALIHHSSFDRQSTLTHTAGDLTINLSKVAGAVVTSSADNAVILDSQVTASGLTLGGVGLKQVTSCILHAATVAHALTSPSAVTLLRVQSYGSQVNVTGGGATTISDTLLSGFGGFGGGNFIAVLASTGPITISDCQYFGQSDTVVAAAAGTTIIRGTTLTGVTELNNRGGDLTVDGCQVHNSRLRQNGLGPVVLQQTLFKGSFPTWSGTGSKTISACLVTGGQVGAATAGTLVYQSTHFDTAQGFAGSGITMTSPGTLTIIGCRLSDRTLIEHTVSNVTLNNVDLSGFAVIRRTVAGVGALIISDSEIGGRALVQKTAGDGVMTFDRCTISGTSTVAQAGTLGTLTMTNCAVRGGGSVTQSAGATGSIALTRVDVEDGAIVRNTAGAGLITGTDSTLSSLATVTNSAGSANMAFTRCVIQGGSAVTSTTTKQLNLTGVTMSSGSTVAVTAGVTPAVLTVLDTVLDNGRVADASVSSVTVNQSRASSQGLFAFNGTTTAASMIRCEASGNGSITITGSVNTTLTNCAAAAGSAILATGVTGSVAASGWSASGGGSVTASAISGALVSANCSVENASTVTISATATAANNVKASAGATVNLTAGAHNTVAVRTGFTLTAAFNTTNVWCEGPFAQALTAVNAGTARNNFHNTLV